MKFFTIGVFNSTENQFFNKLIENGIDTFCDIRQRRGVRGSKYSFVNSNRLQQKLRELNIKYLYIQDLAPTTNIRDLQKKADKEKGELKTERQQLGEVFVTEYNHTILEHFNFGQFIVNLEQLGCENVVIFCVEENAKACHRSLVTQKIASDLKFPIQHL